MNLRLESHSVDDVVVLRCMGSLTHATEASALSKKVADLVTHTRRLVVELSDVETIDTAGLGALVMALIFSRASGCVAKLASPSPRVRRLLELTNLLSLFETHASLDNAIRSFKGPLAKKASHAA